MHLLCDRSNRESTPCSLITDPDCIRTPGSTTRPTMSTEANRRLQNSMPRHIPNTKEMDEFFANAEEKQRRQFIEKYFLISAFSCFLLFLEKDTAPFVYEAHMGFFVFLW